VLRDRLVMERQQLSQCHPGRIKRRGRGGFHDFDFVKFRASQDWPDKFTARIEPAQRHPGKADFRIHQGEWTGQHRAGHFDGKPAGGGDDRQRPFLDQVSVGPK
jgi:hypothetical protein